MPRRKDGDDEDKRPIEEREKTPGYRRREEEYGEVEDAGGSLNAQTAGLVRGRQRALERQANIIRLRRRQRGKRAP